MVLDDCPKCHERSLSVNTSSNTATCLHATKCGFNASHLVDWGLWNQYYRDIIHNHLVYNDVEWPDNGGKVKFPKRPKIKAIKL